MTNPKLIIGTVAGFVILALVIYWAKVNWFEAGGLFVTENEDVTAAYRLNVKGDDLRVYEFTPLGASNQTCIVVAGERNSMMECVDTVGRREQ